MLKKSKLYKVLFGYDIFISYSRKDGLDYAYAIATYFIANGYECFLDQLSSIHPGQDLPDSIKNAVVKSTAFILVGSEGTFESDPVKKEVGLFLLHNRNRPLIPIKFGNANIPEAKWFEQIEGLAFINDTVNNLHSGTPSALVNERISNSLIFTKKSKRLRKIAIGILVAVLSITLVSAGVSYFQVKQSIEKVQAAGQRQQVAESKADSANALAVNAELRSASALESKMEADSLKAIAIHEKGIIDSLKDISDKMTAANALASKANDILRTDPTQSLLMSARAFGIYKTPASADALFSAYLSSPFYSFSKSFTFAQPFPNGKYIALLDINDNLSVVDWNGVPVKFPPIRVANGSDWEKVNWRVSEDNNYIIVNSSEKAPVPKIISLKTGREINIRKKLLDNLFEKDTGTRNIGISGNAKIYAAFHNDQVMLFDILNEGMPLISSIELAAFNPLGGVFASNDLLVLWNSEKIYQLDISKKQTADFISGQKGIYDVQVSNTVKKFPRLHSSYLDFHTKEGSYFQSRSFKEGTTKKMESIPNRVIFSEDDGEVLVLNFRTNNAMVMRSNYLSPKTNLVGGHLSEILCGNFSKDNDLVVTGAEDNLAIVWQKKAINYMVKYILKGHNQPLKQVFFSPDSKKVLTTSFDNSTKIWDIDTPDKTELKSLNVRYNEKKSTYEYQAGNSWKALAIKPQEIIDYILKTN